MRNSGQVAGEDPDPDVGRQTAAVLERIDRLLAEAGTNKSRLLSAEATRARCKKVL